MMFTIATQSKSTAFLSQQSLLMINLLLLFFLLSASFVRCDPKYPHSSRISEIHSTERQNLNGGFDHRAHAVPGGPYVAYDHTGSGRTQVLINGVRSHSHFFDPKKNRLGRIVSYVWVITTSNNRKICTKQQCAVSLPLGKHTVKLTVTDNTGDVASATTLVRILDGGKKSVRVLYLSNTPWIPNINQYKLKADWSQTSKQINLWGKSSFQKKNVFSSPFSIRLYAEIDIMKAGSYVFQLDCGSVPCAIIFDKQLALSNGNGKRNFYRNLQQKAYQFQIIWRSSRPNPTNPRIVLRWMPPGTQGFSLVPAFSLSHRPGLIQPVIHFLSPTSIKPDSTLSIIGTGFIPGSSVSIGGIPCRDVKMRHQFKLTCEVDAVPGTTKYVSVTNTRGITSNFRKLIILSSGNGNKNNNDNKNNRSGGKAGSPKGIGYETRINFSQKTLRKNGGGEWFIPQPTSVVHGPDGRFYFATRDGSIFVTEINGDSVNVICKSEKLNDNRAVLGLAFNPKDREFKLYASASILDFPKAGKSVAEGWKNGQIILFKKSGDCVKKSKTIISGLPVSAFDHAVNKLAFDNNGILYFTVGSNTNAGVASSLTLNLKDSKLSAAILSAPVMKKGFNGNIQYANGGRPETAKKIRGDVNVFATGVRNSFGLQFHSSGSLYATDNGGNQAYGPKSTGCNSETGAQDEVDKLLRIRKNGFYGVANRARGGRECVHYSASSNNNQKTPGNYDKYLTTMEAATTGILEYTANTFGGGLRENLMLSQIAMSYANGKLYRVQLKNDGTVNKVFQMNQWSGADIAMTGEGDLIMPRVYQNKVVMLKANEQDPGIVVVTSVWPWRGPKSGGNIVTVTGWGLKGNVKISFSGKNCKNVQVIGSNGRKVKCTVPSGAGKVAVIASSNGKKSGSYGFEYMYMN